MPTSPIHLLNLAWGGIEADSDGYCEWEERSAKGFLEADTSL